MNAAITRTPSANSRAWGICAPVSSRPSRIASAQPPANAAPNTSAPIRIAALMTVTTLGQTIWRGADGGGCELIGQDPFVGRNLSEKAGLGKHKRVFQAQKSPIACYRSAAELPPLQDILCQKRLNRLPVRKALKTRC